MGRGRIYARGWRAELRIHCEASSPIATAAQAATVDRVLRRSNSLLQFVVRVDAVPARKEIVIRIAALRREATDRIDTAIIRILRCMFPEATRGEWVDLPPDGHRAALKLFTDCGIIEEKDALALMAKLGEIAPGDAPSGKTFISSAETPICTADEA